MDFGGTSSTGWRCSESFRITTAKYHSYVGDLRRQLDPSELVGERIESKRKENIATGMAIRLFFAGTMTHGDRNYIVCLTLADCFAVDDRNRKVVVTFLISYFSFLRNYSNRFIYANTRFDYTNRFQ